MGWQPQPRSEAEPAGTSEPIHPAPDETSLVHAAQRNRAAFAPLYERYLAPVYRYCRFRLGSQEAAEDATSEVFTRVLAALPTYQARGVPFAAWLFRIAHNLVVDRQRRSRPTVPLAVAGSLVDRAPTPEGAVVAADERSMLQAALAQLSADQRAVVELQLAGWSGPQIAAILGKRPEAVRMLRVRALRRLRIMLQEDAND